MQRADAHAAEQSTPLFDSHSNAAVLATQLQRTTHAALTDTS